MGKDFLRSKPDQKKLCVIVLCAGIVMTAGLGIQAYQDTKLQNGCELPKNEAGSGSSEQEMVAFLEDEKIPVMVDIAEERFSKEMAEEKLEEASRLLDNLLRADNESLSKVTKDLNFIDEIPESPVEVEWTSGHSGYFYSDGSLRKDAEITEPIELELTAILSCQEYSRDYQVTITLFPPEMTKEEIFSDYVRGEIEKQETDQTIILPESYEGRDIRWRKPLDPTFLFVLFLTAGSVALMKAGRKKDEQEEKKRRREEMEKDYAEVIGKFTMLLSAGLSVRNAWERIVTLYQKKQGEKKAVYEEMFRSFQEMQKGISELEVYEKFGIRTGLVSYKKLMSLFISDQKRGSIRLLEAMEREMYQAWEEQKRKTRQQGEKIGTKLLIPMMGMLAVVFLIILVPAFLSFQL